MSATLKTVGDWSAQMEVALGNALAATVELTGRSGRQACGMAMVYMAKSARSQTKQSRKKRPVVSNPDDSWKTDRRRAPFGVMRYNRDGTQRFQPIFRTGEFGKYRFFDKKSMSWFEHFRGDGAKWVKIASGADDVNPQLIVPGIMTDKRRIIRKRGLAKRSWMWGIKGLRASETSGGREIPGVVDLQEHIEPNLCGYIMTNRLSYILKAAPANVAEKAATGATNQIMAQMARKVEQQFGIIVPRLAAQRARKEQRRLDQVWRATNR